MTRHIGVSAVLLTALSGWLWGASGRLELSRALQAATLHDHLLEARVSLLGARVNFYDGNFREMHRQLETAQAFVGRARAHLNALGVNDGPEPAGLAVLSLEIEEALRLVTRLQPGFNPGTVDDARVAMGTIVPDRGPRPNPIGQGVTPR